MKRNCREPNTGIGEVGPREHVQLNKPKTIKEQSKTGPHSANADKENDKLRQEIKSQMEEERKKEKEGYKKTGNEGKKTLMGQSQIKLTMKGTWKILI